jgi:hypothetical protein
LKVAFVDASNLKLSYGSGGRDANVNGDINSYVVPTDISVFLQNAAPFTWYRVKVKLDFSTNTTAFSLTDYKTSQSAIDTVISFPDELKIADKRDFGALSFVSHGAGYEGGDEHTVYEDYKFHQYIDNFKIYAYDTSASYNVAVKNGSGSGEYSRDASVTVEADPPDQGKLFRGWTKIPADLVMIQDATNPLKWTFTMPAKNVTLTPIYKDPYTVTVDKGTVVNGTDDGKFAEGDKVSVTAQTPADGYIVKGWSIDPDTVKITKDKTNPLIWTFIMPEGNVTLSPNYRLENEPTDISMVDEYYFKSDHYSEVPIGDEPTAEFIVAGASGVVNWSSDKPVVATVSGDGLVTAGFPGVATISATVGEETYYCKVYTPLVSESFENQEANLWGFSEPSTASNDLSAGQNYSAVTQFHIVEMDGADGESTKAFEFATWREDLARTGQKNFSLAQDPDILKLKFDWNIGEMHTNSTWISVKDDVFERGTINKGHRYFMLQANHGSASVSTLRYGSGGVDCRYENGDRHQEPANMQSLFGGEDIPVNTWLNVDATLDFSAKTTSLTVTRTDSLESETILIPFPSDVNGEFGAFTFMSAAAGNEGNPKTGESVEDYYANSSVRAYIDNFNIYGEDYPSYNVTVNNGTGGGPYKAGETVQVAGDKSGKAARSWTTVPANLVLTQDEDDPNIWTFVMPASDVVLTPVFGDAYEISIGEESSGGAGKMRELTLIGALKGKYLAARITDNGKVSAAFLPAEKSVILSYQKTGAKIEAWIVDSEPALDGSDLGVDVFASAIVNG